MFKLRDYQLKAHTQIEQKFREGIRKLLLVLSTGGGKSKIIVSFIDKHKDHFNFVLIVRGRKLVDQLSEDTKLFNLEYGVLMAGHEEYDPRKPIQVCSIDTIRSRGDYPRRDEEKDLIIIIDEADQAKASSYQSVIKHYFKRPNGRTFLLGVTATPFNGLDFFEDWVRPITADELKQRGFLVDYRYYIPKNSIDYSGVTISKGEWSTKQVSAKLNNPEMIKNSFHAWQEYGENRKTLVFCIDKKHAKRFCSYVNMYYEKEIAKFIHEKTPDDERKNIFNEFANGNLIFLVNLKIITRGVDLPIIGAILDLCSTLQINLHIQKLGRGSRPNEVYPDCIVIDPAKNLLNNGHFYEHREIDLTNPYKRNRKDLEDIQMRVCAKCFRAGYTEKFIRLGECPYCGFKNKVKKAKPLSDYMKQKLFMEQATPEAIEQKKIINDFKKTLWKKQNLGRRYQYDMARKLACFDIIKKYGLDRAMKVQRSIGLTPDLVQEYNSKYNYKPLGECSANRNG